MLKTVEGEPLKISEDNGHVFVSGEKSGVAEITIPNVTQSNGVIQDELRAAAELTAMGLPLGRGRSVEHP